MPDRVICDTSPLFYLHRLRHLALLQKLYRRILVPEAVITELLAGRDQGEDVPVLTQYDWIEVHRVRTQNVLPLISDLGSGEAQVLALTLEQPGSLVILDDRYACETGGTSETGSKFQVPRFRLQVGRGRGMFGGEMRARPQRGA
jgi:uncharacterized protein